MDFGAMHQDIVESSDDGYWVFDLDGQTLTLRPLDLTVEKVEWMYRKLAKRPSLWSDTEATDVESFRELGTRFLQMPLGEVERVRIG